ncbi:uracil-DNA glycosylase family protein [Acidicapsa acidisoli]|uniref:uracil-DNA glycosylase family protein n=1 Tax=Acidicapsa acidisoli TaxID=1615681 RepID=UPI0021DFB514|nr:uracil-DNA glycosylase family protein [Acidicapsa acidisoli]
MPPEEIDSLRKKLDQLDLKGTKIRPFKGLPVMDKAFFPGGNGLFEGSGGTLPRDGILVLGSNFGCVADFIDEAGNLVRLDETFSSATWKGLRSILPKTPIKFDECFFTNAWPYLHEGKSNLTKGLISIWLRDDSLMKEGVRFFKETLSTIQPRLIVALGTGAPIFLSRIWPRELEAWGGNSTTSMDEIPMAEVSLDCRVAVCTAITHPSWPPNANLRKAPYQGREGEIRLLKEAAARAGIG